MNRFPAISAVTSTRSKSFWFALLVVFSLAAPLPSARADFTPEGDISPSDLSTWDYNSTVGCIGNTASGTLTVDSGTLSSYLGYIGYDSAATGLVNIAGMLSRWKTYGVCVGYSGSGTVLLANGGRLLSELNSESNASYLGYNAGSTGVVSVNGSRSSWSNEFDVYVGNFGSGTVSVTGGGSVSNALHSLRSDIYIGYGSGSMGAVTVDGAGSTWSGYGTFRVGWSGNGTLSITNGGSVTAAQTWVGTNAGSTGVIDFGTNGGTLTTGGLFASPTQLAGTGTIIAYGLVSDIDLRFDATHGPGQAIRFQQPGQDVTLNLLSTGALGAGWKGQGSLTIQDGRLVNSFEGYIGYGSGSTGVATVSGSGSTWNVNRGLVCVGNYGSGTLSITGGGSVSCSESNSYIGNFSGSKGVVTVDGAGSIWSTSYPMMVGNSGSGTLSINNGGSVSGGACYVGASAGSTGMVTVDGAGSIWTGNGLFVGSNGSGTLSITGGGAGTATSVSTNNKSLLAIDVGRGSLLTVGSGAGTLTNNGTIRILAGAGVPLGGVQYSPISAGTWGGTGTYQAIGGTWNSTGHTFIASSVTAGTSGSAVQLDLTSVQRTLIDDYGSDGTGWEVGASFVAVTPTTREPVWNITFTATAATDDLLGLLRSRLSPNESILSGWTFSTDNYAYAISSTDPVYLSFKVGPGYATDRLDLWSYNGTSWATYVPADLTYDGTYASFAATALSGYAVTAVPEPGTLALLAAGFLGLAAYALRKKKKS